MKLIKPMLLEQTPVPFDNEAYIFEPKLDGWRVIAYLTSDKTTLISRGGLDVTHKFSELGQMHTCTLASCVLDGEIVADNGFWAVRKGISVKYVPFDILEIDGNSIMDKPLIERKKILSQALFPANHSLISIPYIERDGNKLFDIAVKQNLEGIIAKRKAGKYYQGQRSNEWIKIKNQKYNRQKN